MVWKRITFNTKVSGIPMSDRGATFGAKYFVVAREVSRSIMIRHPRRMHNSNKKFR